MAHYRKGLIFHHVIIGQSHLDHNKEFEDTVSVVESNYYTLESMFFTLTVSVTNCPLTAPLPYSILNTLFAPLTTSAYVELLAGSYAVL
jgi:hypothetical protein